VKTLYASRKLSRGHPELEKLSGDGSTSVAKIRPDEKSRVEKMLIYLNRLVDLGRQKKVLVLGCGPTPQVMKILMEDYGYDVVGVEPIPSYVRSAAEYVGMPDRILMGTAESIPLEDASQGLVLLESVLEHVDSVEKSLDEIFRVLVPGGIVVVHTTNRYRFSLRGDTGEFRVRYFNWLPDVVKECFVFHHLHYKPDLANYTPRPAVHWFSYADLCKLGRQAGFAQFYSFLDLANTDDPAISRSKIRSFLLNKLKFNPWLRAMALTQLGGAIIMLKRTT